MVIGHLTHSLPRVGSLHALKFYFFVGPPLVGNLSGDTRWGWKIPQLTTTKGRFVHVPPGHSTFGNCFSPDFAPGVLLSARYGYGLERNASSHTLFLSSLHPFQTILSSLRANIRESQVILSPER